MRAMFEVPRTRDSITDEFGDTEFVSAEDTKISVDSATDRASACRKIADVASLPLDKRHTIVRRVRCRVRVDALRI
jgi:hypothetical protein